MKKHLITLFILIISEANAQTNNLFYVKQANNINCIETTFDADKNIDYCASYFNVSPEILKLYNTISADKIVPKGTTVVVPLTETNFFKTNKVKSITDDQFVPVYYLMQNSETNKDVCRKFLISETQIFNLNNKVTANKPKGDVIIGMLKINPDAGNDQELTFKQALIDNNKTRFNNWKYAAVEAKDLSKNVLSPSVDGSNKLNSKKETPTTANSTVGNIKDKISSSVNSTKNFITSTFKNDDKKLAKQQEKERLNQENAQKIIDQNLARSKNSVITNAPSLEVENKIEKPIDIANNSSNNSEPEIEKGNSVYQLAQDNTIQENDSKLIPEEPKAITPTVVENPVSNTTESVANNAIKGKASWFFSGPIGGEYYVFTNYAEKGKTVTLKCVKTQKSIKAKVLGGLRTDEATNGILLLLSDNAKDTLGLKDSVFSIELSK